MSCRGLQSPSHGYIHMSDDDDELLEYPEATLEKVSSEEELYMELLYEVIDIPYIEETVD